MGLGARNVNFSSGVGGRVGQREWAEHGSKMYLIVQSNFVYEK